MAYHHRKDANISAEQGTPKQPSPEEIDWARHLLCNQRNIVLGTVHADEPHMTVLYSSFSFEGDDLIARWRSFPETRHSKYIDERRSAVTAPVGYTAVKFLLFDSSRTNVSLKLDGHARRVPETSIAEAIESMAAIRQRRGEGFDIGRPEVPYEAVITRAMIPVPLLTQEGVHVGETYAPIPLQALVGFDAVKPPGRGSSAL